MDQIHDTRVIFVIVYVNHNPVSYGEIHKLCSFDGHKL